MQALGIKNQDEKKMNRNKGKQKKQKPKSNTDKNKINDQNSSMIELANDLKQQTKQLKDIIEFMRAHVVDDENVKEVIDEKMKKLDKKTVNQFK